jgi:DNA polymerase delta subunit 1
MVTPAKRVLAETTNSRQNIPPSSQTPAAKKIRLNGHRVPNGNENRSFSSQPKSQFEEHLEKLSSSINDLKELNAERDQKWARPVLQPFNPATESLCFQQIDAEEGTVSGGKQTVRLFGVTEVRLLLRRVRR